MKTLLVILFVGILIIIFIVSGCYSRNTIKGSGNKISESRELDNFSSLELFGSIDVNMSFGKEYSCIVEGDDNLVHFIRTEVKDQQLQILIKQNYSTIKGLLVNITAPEYDKVSILGSGDVNLSDVNHETLSLKISGSGNIIAIGRVKKLLANVNGSGDLKLSKLQSNNATITINGSGDAKIWASESLTAKVNGSGDITYYGDPENVQSKVNGSGNIIKN